MNSVPSSLVHFLCSVIFTARSIPLRLLRFSCGRVHEVSMVSWKALLKRWSRRPWAKSVTISHCRTFTLLFNAMTFIFHFWFTAPNFLHDRRVIGDLVIKVLNLRFPPMNGQRCSSCVSSGGKRASLYGIWSWKSHQRPYQKLFGESHVGKELERRGSLHRNAWSIKKASTES